MRWSKCLQAAVSFARGGAVAVTPDDARAWLSGREMFGIKLGLEAVGRVLERLGAPHRCAPAVHIAGTNGKGSTGALLEAILLKAGLRTGFYCSPHLIDVNERVRIAGRPLDDSRLAEGLSKVRAAAEATAVPITYFEATTALAFWAFREAAVDAAIVEVGLGGRLDATNVVRPEVSIITSIAIEHEAHLGRSIGEIAREKAGIVKPGVPVVSAARRGRGREEIERVAREREAPAEFIETDLRLRPRGGKLYDFLGPELSLFEVEVGLAGRHQAENALLALAALRHLRGRRRGPGIGPSPGIEFSKDAVRAGLARPKWRGRFEQPRGFGRLVLDGAHNPAATEALAATLREEYGGARVILVFGALSDKDVAGMLGHFRGLARRILLARVNTPRSLDPARIDVESGVSAEGIERIGSVAGAIERALAIRKKREVICVTGSLYAVGESLQFLRSRQRGLRP